MMSRPITATYNTRIIVIIVVAVIVWNVHVIILLCRQSGGIFTLEPRRYSRRLRGCDGRTMSRFTAYVSVRRLVLLHVDVFENVLLTHVPELTHLNTAYFATSLILDDLCVFL